MKVANGDGGGGGGGSSTRAGSRRVVALLAAMVALTSLALLSDRRTGGLVGADVAVVVGRPDEEDGPPADVEPAGADGGAAPGASAALRGDAEAAGRSEGTLLPVVAFYMSDTGNGKLPADHYTWDAVRAALVHQNHYVLITNAQLSVPDDINGRFEIVDLNSLNPPDIATFTSVYKGWGSKEPREAYNFRRFYYLEAYMEREGLDMVFYADSDVAVLERLTSSLLQPGCDAMVDLNDGNEQRVDWSSYIWTVWAGSGVLTRRVVEEWNKFTITAYSDTAVVDEILRLKKKKKPYVCDMTLWYLYAVAVDADFAAFAKATAYRAKLPAAPQRKLCESVKLGFDHQHAWRRKGFKFDARDMTATVSGEPIRSMHFQGIFGKAQMPRFFKTAKRLVQERAPASPPPIV